MRRAAKIDDNQNDIVDAIRKVPGFTVTITSSLGKGFPDIVVGFGGFNGMYEIKDPKKPPSARKLTKDEGKFHDAWFGHIKVAETATEIIVDMRLHADLLKQARK